MGTGFGCAIGEEIAIITIAVIALGTGRTSCQSRFAISGLMDLASSALVHESGGSLCFCSRHQSLATQVVPFLLGTRVVDTSVQGASEVANLLTQTRDVSVYKGQLCKKAEPCIKTYDGARVPAAEVALLAILFVVVGR